MAGQHQSNPGTDILTGGATSRVVSADRDKDGKSRKHKELSAKGAGTRRTG